MLHRLPDISIFRFLFISSKEVNEENKFNAKDISQLPRLNLRVPELSYIIENLWKSISEATTHEPIVLTF